MLLSLDINMKKISLSFNFKLNQNISPPSIKLSLKKKDNKDEKEKMFKGIKKERETIKYKIKIK